MMELALVKLSLRIAILLICLVAFFAIKFLVKRFTSYNTDEQLSKGNWAVALYEGLIAAAMFIALALILGE